VPTTQQEAAVLKKPSAIGLAIVTMIFAAPTGAAAQITLTVDPVARCYAEQDTVYLRGTGFTQNGEVVFTRNDRRIGAPILADPGGEVQPSLILPGIRHGQQQLTYVATDSTNPGLTAQLTMLVTATDVGLRPAFGPPHRLLRITARGFFDGPALYAHVVRLGKRGARARNMRIGALKGACRRVQAHRRLFSRATPPGRYRVQFDVFRRYQSRRGQETDFVVTVERRGGTARASGFSPPS
jgi:hypothetical protein